MKIEHHMARLDALENEIHRLEADLVESRRAVNDPTLDERAYGAAVEREMQAKIAFDRALVAHFIESSFVLSQLRNAERRAA